MVIINKQERSMKQLIINEALNGYYVLVDNYSVIFNQERDLLEGIKLYFGSPEEFKERYRTGVVKPPDPTPLYGSRTS